ncbi:MAG: DUF1028 domain-containing protein [Candidatus Polarisedimenticolia bacterium]
MIGSVTAVLAALALAGLPLTTTVSLSIVALDPATGDVGVAVASHTPASGAAVPWVRAGVGAMAVQAWLDPTLGPRALDLLSEGITPREVLARLLAVDARAERRQMALMDARGGCATHTGRETPAQAGAVEAPTFCVQGNDLTGTAVLEAMAAAFRAAEAQRLPLADRLLASLAAGDATRGHRLPLRSAALRLASTDAARQRDRANDLRVDDAEDPVAALRSLRERAGSRLGHRLLWQAAGPDVKELQELLRRAGLLDREPTGTFDDATAAAVEAFRRAQGLGAGDPGDRLGLVDDRLLDRLRAAAAAATRR